MVPAASPVRPETDPSRSTRARRLLLVVALIALVAAAALALGWAGYRLEVGTLRISAREPRNPLVLAIVAVVVAWALAPAGSRGRALIADGRALARSALPSRQDRGAWMRAAERAAPAVSAMAAVAATVVALTLGAPVAGGSDSYGYVSQAHLWATGRLRDELPLLRELAPAVHAEALLPLGYILSADRESMVPTYSPGLPMVMSVFERVFGRHAVFWVVPLLGGVAVWATYLLGRSSAGPFAGALAAVLFAASPAFLLQLTAAPMSEVPATAWWTLSLALLFSQRRWAAPASGLAAGLAILTRPNLVPLAIVPGALLLWRARSAAPQRRRLLLFCIPAVAACLVVAALNAELYGSPLRSGYDVRGLYGLEHARPNLARYPALLTDLQTPAIWLALAAPWLARLRRERAGTDTRSADAPAVTAVEAVFVLVVFVSYLFYPAFDAYYTLRFLLPGLPALFALLAFTLVVASRRLDSRWRVIAAVLVVGLLAAGGLTYAATGSAFHTWSERRYALIGEHIASRLPERAVLFAMQHSGSARYYSGRPIVRWDQLPPERLDRVVKKLGRLGYHPYFLLDEWEVPLFRERFERQSSVGALDWPPAVRLEYVNVRIWDPADRGPRGAVRKRETEIVRWPFATR